ncbi:MAG: glycosyltransferase family 39 protein [Deltaproteobacteria bacterium]|nr:glycosyltransferase family 39 protein [Deltaproteobacteria bacterium]
MTINSLSIKLVFLVLITLVTRVIAFLQPQIIPLDGVLWVKMARLFSEGGYTGVAGSYFNLYPFLIFLVQKFLGDWELSGRIISLATGTLTVIPVFLLGRSLFDERIAWLSAIFYLTLPNFLEYDNQTLRDPLFWFLMAITLWLVWEGFQKNRPVLFGLASISAGLGALTRVEGFVLWVGLAFYTAFRKKEGISVRRRVWNLSLLALFFPMLLSLMLFSLKIDSSRKAFAFGEMTSFSFDFIKAHSREILKPRNPIDAMGEKAYNSLPNISKDSLELANRHRFPLAILDVIYKFVKSTNLLILLILLGFWKRKKEGFQSPDWFLSFIFAALFVMSVFYARQIYYFSTRHGLTLVLPVLFFAGHGLNFISEVASRRFRHLTGGYGKLRQYLPHLIAVFLVTAFLIQGVSSGSAEKLLQKEVGLWLKEKGFQGSVIMGPKRYSRLAFYADGRFMEMPGSWGEAIDRIQKEGVKIVVVNSCTIDQDCPGFSENWSNDRLLLLQGPEGRMEGCRIEIYKVY